MADFVKGGGTGTPFGRNEFLRSTNPKPITESYTMSKNGIPAETIDGTSQKILQPGTVLASITSGPEAGKVGVFQAGATDGRADLDNIVGLVLTFLPWQLLERDVEVSVVYDAVAVQAWCFEYNAAGERIPLSNATADAMVAGKRLDVRFA